MRVLGAADIEIALPMPQAMAVMRDAFVAITEGGASVAERQSLQLERGTGLLMGAAADGIGIAVKVVSVMPGNPAHGLPGTIGSLLLMSATTGQPLALMDGTALTAWRTAAVSACAVDLLARPDARKALLCGCGTQASTQVLGLDAARELDEIVVYALDAGQVGRFIESCQPGVRARLEAVTTLPQAVAGADIIVAATSSQRPVFDASDISPGCHVNGIGSYRPGMCEIDPAIAGRAAVFVESRRTAATEGGELVAAIETGVARSEDWVEVGEVIGGRARGRQDGEQVTFFKSVGHAVFDLYAARAILDSIEERE